MFVLSNTFALDVAGTQTLGLRVLQFITRPQLILVDGGFVLGASTLNDFVDFLRFLLARVDQDSEAFGHGVFLLKLKDRPDPLAGHGCHMYVGLF
jgi:hypothetical protein